AVETRFPYNLATSAKYRSRSDSACSSNSATVADANDSDGTEPEAWRTTDRSSMVSFASFGNRVISSKSVSSPDTTPLNTYSKIACLEQVKRFKNAVVTSNEEE